MVFLVDDQAGYDGYKCNEFDYYCAKEGEWYDKFRAVCPATCLIGKICLYLNCTTIAYENHYMLSYLSLIIHFYWIIVPENKTLGQWSDYGTCVAIGDDKSCGPGNQHQRRDCADGSADKCEDSHSRQQISCNLKNCAKVYGTWTDVGPCIADGGKSDCGPGTKSQTRSCKNGTIDECIESDMSQIVVCSLPDCPKILGNWDTSEPCKSDNGEKFCGPGIQHQTRACSDGTSDKCTAEDMQQDTRCSLSDCKKEVGKWISGAPCESSGDYKYCGTGQMMQTRDCIDGTKDICTDDDIQRYTKCKLPSCYFKVGNWTDVGGCVGKGNRKNCGAGFQRQERSCVDGVITQCTAQDKEQRLPCTLDDCQKVVGGWVDAGECKCLNNKDCGPGIRLQTSNCLDGTTDKCTAVDTARNQNCKLPDCQKKTENWTNFGECVGSGSNKNCGLGEQFQVRSCTDGTIDKCTDEDQRRAIPCNLQDCPKITGATWINDGGCIASAADNLCGPSAGTQKQTRTCIDGTNDRCQSIDREQTISCDLPDCPGKLSFIVSYSFDGSIFVGMCRGFDYMQFLLTIRLCQMASNW